MTRQEELENMLRILLAMCDRLKAEAMEKDVAWDDRKPTIFYLQRNMEWARELLTHNDASNRTPCEADGKSNDGCRRSG